MVRLPVEQEDGLGPNLVGEADARGAAGPSREGEKLLVTGTLAVVGFRAQVEVGMNGGVGRKRRSSFAAEIGAGGRHGKVSLTQFALRESPARIETKRMSLQHDYAVETRLGAVEASGRCR